MIWALVKPVSGYRTFSRFESTSRRPSTSTWVDRTNALYRGIAILPLRIAIGGAEDGGQYVYVGFKGNGFIRGKK